MEHADDGRSGTSRGHAARATWDAAFGCTPFPPSFCCGERALTLGLRSAPSAGSAQASVRHPQLGYQIDMCHTMARRRSQPSAPGAGCSTEGGAAGA